MKKYNSWAVWVFGNSTYRNFIEGKHTVNSHSVATFEYTIYFKLLGGSAFAMIPLISQKPDIEKQ
jgi:hypothetical protein